MPEARVGVIGGGIMGLAVARELAKAGLAVEVLEAGPELGGLAGSQDFGPFVWDRFYHCLVGTDDELLSLLRELGLGDHVRWEKTVSGFYYGGRCYPFDSVVDLLRFAPLRVHDRLRLGLFVLACRYLFDGRQLEDWRASTFLRRCCGRRTWEIVWQPLPRAKLGPAAEVVAARFIWDSINRLQSTRKGIRKQERLGYVAGGYRRVLAAFVSHLESVGVDCRLGVGVHAVRPTAGGSVEVEADDGKHHYNEVILTVSNTAAAQILPEAVVRRARLNQVEYLGVVVAGVVLRKSISPFYILNISDPTIDLTGVIGTSNLVKDGTFQNYHFYYLPKYLAAQDPAWNLDRSGWEEHFRSQLQRLVPTLTCEDIVALKIASARQVQPVLGCGYRRSLPSVELGLPGVWLINSSQCYQGPIHVNLIVGHARRALRTTGMVERLTGGT